MATTPVGLGSTAPVGTVSSMTVHRLTTLALSALLVTVAAPSCSDRELPAPDRTTTTLTLEDLDVEDLDPLAAVDVSPVGPSPDAVVVDTESLADLGGGRFQITAFVRTCATVAEARFDEQGVYLLVVDPICDGPNQLVRLTASAPPGWARPAP